MRLTIIVLFFVFPTLKAFSCSCQNPTSVLQAYNGAELVISGTIKKIEIVPLIESIKEIPLAAGSALCIATYRRKHYKSRSEDTKGF